MSDLNYWDELMGTDEGAASYMDSYGEGPNSETRHIIGNFINDDETVLDVGCGPGWNFDHFKMYGPDVKAYRGLDYSDRFVRIANQRSSEKGWANPYAIGDCRDLKEPDNSWDVVILQDVLEHTNGYVKPVKEALRVATRRVIIVFWRPFNENGIETINDDGNDGYGATYDQGKWEKFLNSTGHFWVDTETSPAANRWHKYYVIDKEVMKA